MARVYKYKSQITADWVRDAVVSGRIVDKERVKIEDREVDVLVIETDRSLTRVFHSEGLKELFETAQVGDFAEVEYLGTITTKNKRPFKQFRSECWSDPDAPALTTRPPRKPRAEGKPKK